MKTKTDSDDFRQFVLEQLSDLPDLVCRRMFGGYGLYQGEHFFGILHKGKLYFKTNAATKPNYEAYGMRPFQPSAKQTLKNYYEIPVEILEDADALCSWAKHAVSVSA